jgi:hypothetical protein
MVAGDTGRQAPQCPRRMKSPTPTGACALRRNQAAADQTDGCGRAVKRPAGVRCISEDTAARRAEATENLDAARVLGGGGCRADLGDQHPPGVSVPTNFCTSEPSHSEGLPRLPDESARTGDEGNRCRKVGSIMQNRMDRIHRYI